MEKILNQEKQFCINYDILQFVREVDIPDTNSYKTMHMDKCDGLVHEFGPRNLLDLAVPLKDGSHNDVIDYRVYYQHLMVTLQDGRCMGMKSPVNFVAYDGEKESPSSILFKNNDLYIEIQIDRNGDIGKKDIAGINDVLFQAAKTTS